MTFSGEDLLDAFLLCTAIFEVEMTDRHVSTRDNASPIAASRLRRERPLSFIQTALIFLTKTPQGDLGHLNLERAVGNFMKR